MVTKPRQTPPLENRLYVPEFMEDRGMKDAQLAKLVGVERVTVTRWRNRKQHPERHMIPRIAAAFDIEPEELWRPPKPGRPSVDRMLKGAPDDVVQEVADHAAVVLRRRLP